MLGVYKTDQNATLLSLAKCIQAISPDVSVEEVAKLFLDDCYSQILTIPIVNDGVVVGSISRYDFMEVYLKLFGRELYANKPISSLMRKNPVKVSGDFLITEASDYITAVIRYPIKEDFIILKEGRYYGMGVVLDLLKAMEFSLMNRQQELDEAYTQLKTSQAQVVQSSKMAALGTMIAGVAHEINTPLGYVRGNVEVIKSTVDTIVSMQRAGRNVLENLSQTEIENQPLKDSVDVLSKLVSDIEQDDLIQETQQLNDDTLYGLDQISEIVMGLKNFSRSDDVVMQRVDVNSALGATLTIAKNVIKDKVEVIKRFGDIPHILCSPSKLNQVFLNVITNAAQAMPEERNGSGEIIVSTSIKENSNSKPCVCISIKDNGVGMDDDVKQKIFDPFFTTKKVGEGTGLGLSICHQIVEQHHGEIVLKTAVDQGTECLILLPVDENSDDANYLEVKVDGATEAHNSPA